MVAQIFVAFLPVAHFSVAYFSVAQSSVALFSIALFTIYRSNKLIHNITSTCTSIHCVSAQKTLTLFTARSSHASAVLKITILSARLSGTRVLSDEMLEHTAGIDILIPYETAITLVLVPT